MMRPLQVYLDERDLKSLEAWARERGWTKSQAIRAAVRALARRPAEDPLLELRRHIRSRTRMPSGFAVMEATRCGHVIGCDHAFAAAGYTLWEGSG